MTIKMWAAAVICLLSLSAVCAQSGCRTPSGASGECISIASCEPIRRIIASGRPSPEETDFLRRSLCGYEGQTPKVCCPRAEPIEQQVACYTPDGFAGACVDVKRCAAVVQLLQQRPLPQERLEYIRKLRCQGPAAYSVCCARAGAADQPAPAGAPDQPAPAGAGECAPSAAPPAPNSGCCGVESPNGNRIVGGNATSIDQYPWMALIEYRRADGRVRTLCGGALVSGRHVLTAGHCVAGDVLKIGTPVNVRLGEYDTSTARDCVPSDGGGEDCADPVVTLPILRTRPHPQYQPTAALRRNDIALVTLSKLAPFTDFIRPICLPATDATASASELRLWAAGWGATNISTSSSTKKLHVDLPYKTLSECQKQYNVPKRSIQLWSKQLCAGGVKDKDSCKGDSGGPLMLEQGSTFEIVGVVSFGTTPCGMEHVPGVYTKVYEYLEWIRGEMSKGG